LASEAPAARQLGRREIDASELETVVLPTTSARSQGERAYLLIRDRIITLKLAPGSVIEEARLRAELELGRTPIREALQRLAHENLVSFVPHRGTFVTDINLTDLRRLTEIRVVMEPYAARLATERAGEADRTAIADLVNQLDAVGEADVLALIQLDQRIHRQVYGATHNPFLQAMLEEMLNLSLRIWFLGLQRGVALKEAIEEHRRLLTGIRSGNSAMAEQAMHEHIVGFEQAIRRVL
jgi:DNA-binding GntR family transcriptional regulator